MLYSFPVTIPADTDEDSPVEVTANLTWGVITHVAVEFPPNCAGLAKVAIYHRRHQVWPTNIDEWFYTDAKVIEWDEYYPLLIAPYALVLLGYNEDDTFEHIPIVRFEVLPPLAAMAKYGVTEGVIAIREIPVEAM